MRYDWIDILKGIGILAVIFTHITGFHGMFIFALPLFFILSGYLAKPTECYKDHIIKNMKRLMIPYTMFFVLFVILDALENGIAPNWWGILHSFLWGGNSLTYDFGVFWYIETLFLALILFNYMQTKNVHPVCFLLIFLLSLTLFVINVSLPWNIQSIPLVLTYMYIGTKIRVCYSPDRVQDMSNNISTVGKLITFISIFAMICMPNIYLDIKYNDYGVPVLSFVLSVVCSMLTAVLLSGVSGTVKNILSYIGRSSLFLMFIHQFIHYRMTFVDNKYIVFVLTTLFSMFLYYIMCKFRYLRILFCGEM